MKARPVKIVAGSGYVECPIAEATTGKLTLPVILKGTREGTNCWTWNGSVDAPTLRPSVLTNGHDFRCHLWVNDGKAEFLCDCSHEHVGKTLDLLDVDRPKTS